MLLTAVIIILREVLEASLLISVLAALSGLLHIRRGWIAWALVAGSAGAVLLAFSINRISGWFDGVGQEVTSATLQLLIYALLAVFIFFNQARARHGCFSDSALQRVMAGIVSLAVIREGFEVLVYVSGFSTDLSQLVTVLVGATIGAGIGISTGSLVYYLLYSLGGVRARIVGTSLLILIAAGMASQAALLLIQADWLPSQLPVWDTSRLIAEESVTGQLLYALAGYEATPTAIQASFYFGGGLVLVLLAMLSRCCFRRLEENHA